MGHVFIKPVRPHYSAGRLALAVSWPVRDPKNRLVSAFSRLEKRVFLSGYARNRLLYAISHRGKRFFLMVYGFSWMGKALFQPVKRVSHLGFPFFDRVLRFSCPPHGDSIWFCAFSIQEMRFSGWENAQTGQKKRKTCSKKRPPGADCGLGSSASPQASTQSSSPWRESGDGDRPPRCGLTQPRRTLRGRRIAARGGQEAIPLRASSP
jgi:hypothetical protein